MDEMKVVHVKWLDPYSVDEWTDLNKLEGYEPMIVESFGYEVHRDKSVTILSLNVDHEIGPQASCSIVIPECCIKEYRVIEGDQSEEATDLHAVLSTGTHDQDE